MIVFDARVLIALLDPADAFHGPTVDFVEEYEEFDFAASVLTVAESLVRPARNGIAEQIRAGLTRLSMLTIDVADDDILCIADVRASTRLRMPDAVALHSAERHGAQLVTTDRTLARAATDRGVQAHLLEPRIG